MPTKAAFERAAQDFVAAYAGDATALNRLNQYYARSFSLADLKAEIWRRDYAYRQRASHAPANHLPLAEAQLLVAQDAGFPSWVKLLEAVAVGLPPQGAPFAVDPRQPRIRPRRRMREADWDELIAVMRAQRIPTLDAGGQMTDTTLARIAELDFVTALGLGGSRELSDDGLLQLAHMPQLEHLGLNEYPGGKLTDRGLEVLQRLPNLRTFEMAWQAGIGDRGAANLRYCDRLEAVNLMGSPTGDGAIAALAGKAELRRFSTGTLTTDNGLAALRDLPRFKAAGELGAQLLVDGPFTDRGLAVVADLEGICELDLFWHVDGITSGGFAALAKLPHLHSLGCDGRLSDDRALGHIAALPHLKRLRIQEAVASDEGFAVLARSATIEDIWGRVCPHFGNRGFRALAQMPALRRLGIGCAQVDDAVLAALPEFPALCELTPIGFSDRGFRHIGRCGQLERLSCMYCRETGDEATAHVSGLGLKYYYAGLTQITDRSLAMLGSMESLEQIDLYECRRLTDAGLAHLARLPRLREIHLDGLPGVTLAGSQVFPPSATVYHNC